MQVTKYQFDQDVENNTAMLKQVPGLADTISLKIGNVIFNPKAETDLDTPYKILNVTIDAKPVIIVTAGTKKARTLYPQKADIFNYEGISYIFKNGGIPLEFKKVVMQYAIHHQNEEYLKLGFTEEEIQIYKRISN